MVPARLLLVDDEAALLQLLTKYLERLGYQVEAFSRPEEALAAYASDPSRYALVLTDLVFGGMNGEQMLERMRALNPKLRAIISSGYPYEPLWRGVIFLQKPFLPKMLAEAIEKILKPGGTASTAPVQPS